MPYNSLEKPLLDAVIGNQYEAAKALLANHAVGDFVTQDDGNTTLHHAILTDNIKMARLLLKHNVNINYQNKKFLTPIKLAASLGKWDFVTLIAEYCKPNEDYWGFYSALCLAAEHDQLACVATLLKAKVKPIQARVDLLSPLDYALANGNNEMIQLLIQHGAKTVSITPRIVSPIMQAAKAGNWEGAILLVKSLDKQKNETDLYEALCYAAEKNQLDSVVALLKAGATASPFSNNNKNEPLHFAVINDNPEMARILVMHAAKIDRKNADGLTPIELATTTGKWKILPVILYAFKIQEHLNRINQSLNECRETHNRASGYVTLAAKLKYVEKFKEFPGTLRKILDLLAQTLARHKDAYGVGVETNKQLMGITQFIIDHPQASLDTAQKTILKRLCDEGNQFANILVELHKYVYWIYNNTQELRNVLREMFACVANTTWRYRGSFGIKKDGNPPHIETLFKNFAKIDPTTCKMSDLFQLYRDVIKTLSNTAEKNSTRLEETQAFYDKYRDMLGKITFANHNIEKSALEIDEEKETKTESTLSSNDVKSKIENANNETQIVSNVTDVNTLKSDTKPIAAPPFTSTTARLYPTLDNSHSTIQIPTVNSNPVTEPSTNPIDAARAYYESAFQGLLSTATEQTLPVNENNKMQDTYVLPEVPKDTYASYIPDFPPPSYNEHVQHTMQTQPTQPTYTGNRSSFTGLNLFPAPSAPIEDDYMNKVLSLPTPPTEKPVVASAVKSAGRSLALAN